MSPIPGGVWNLDSQNGCVIQGCRVLTSISAWCFQMPTSPKWWRFRVYNAKKTIQLPNVFLVVIYGCIQGCVVAWCLVSPKAKQSPKSGQTPNKCHLGLLPFLGFKIYSFYPMFHYIMLCSVIWFMGSTPYLI